MNKLKRIRRYFERLDKIRENEKIKDKAKEKIAKAFQKHINRKIDKLIRRIQRRSGKGIDPETASQLVKDKERTWKLSFQVAESKDLNGPGRARHASKARQAGEVSRWN